MYKTILGKEIAKEVRKEISKEVSFLNSKYKKDIGLAVVLVGDDPASKTYVKNKINGCKEVGIKSYEYRLPADVLSVEVENLVNALAKNDDIHGILVQLPLPKHIDERKILSLIPDNKDVDGFSPTNIGKLFMGNPSTVSCTPFGIMKMLEYIKYDLSGKKALVIGRSNIVGKPMSALLLNANSTVTIAHSRTKNLKDIALESDIIVVAIGKAKFLTGDMVKEGAVVIDVGINRVDGHLVGDVDFDSVAPKCSYITPVPGGVGPMTITMLLYNVVNLFKNGINC